MHYCGDSRLVKDEISDDRTLTITDNLHRWHFVPVSDRLVSWPVKQCSLSLTLTRLLFGVACTALVIISIHRYVNIRHINRRTIPHHKWQVVKVRQRLLCRWWFQIAAIILLISLHISHGVLLITSRTSDLYKIYSDFYIAASWVVKPSICLYWST